MNIKLNNILLMVLCLFSTSCASLEEKITLQEIINKESIKVNDLKRIDLDLKQGHGPYLWSKVDNEKEAWFWCKPGIMSALGRCEIVLITYVNANDEDDGTIIWPKEKVGHDFGKELRLLYPR
jgi:hypothetical protein